MPWNKTGSKQVKVNAQQLEKAVFAVVDKSISLREAIEVYDDKEKNFSLKTLHRHVQKFKNEGREKFEYKNLRNWKHIFNEKEETQLVNYCIKVFHYAK